MDSIARAVRELQRSHISEDEFVKIIADLYDSASLARKLSSLTEPTQEDYKQAQDLVENYKVCEGLRCKKLFKNEDITRTIYYGITKYWCAKCYASVKDD